MRTRIFVLLTSIFTAVTAVACGLLRPRITQPPPHVNGVVVYGAIAYYGRNRNAWSSAGELDPR